MEAQHLGGLTSLFQKSEQKFADEYVETVAFVLSMSRHPTFQDSLCELSRSELCCLMAITSLARLNVAVSLILKLHITARRNLLVNMLHN